MNAVIENAVEPETVWDDVQRIVKRYREETKLVMDEYHALELARIANLESTYWAAWERSCKETQRTKTKRKSDGASEAVKLPPFFGQVVK